MGGHDGNGTFLLIEEPVDNDMEVPPGCQYLNSYQNSYGRFYGHGLRAVYYASSLCFQLLYFTFVFFLGTNTREDVGGGMDGV